MSFPPAYPRDLIRTNWTPAYMQTAAWFRADDGASTVDGTQPTKWLDRSGNGIDGTRSGTPTWTKSAVNGKPAFLFDGVDDRFDLGNIYSGAPSVYAIGVCKIDADPSAADSASGPWLGDTGTDGSFRDHYPWTDGNVYHGFGTTARKSAGNPSVSLATWHISEFSSAASDWQFRVNGASVFTTATNTVGLGATPAIAYSLRGATTTYMKGYVGEVVAVKGVPSSALLARLQGYLAHKYGLAGQLAAGHTYKTTPPMVPMTGTVEFYAASSSGGTVNVRNVVSLTRGVVTAWQQI